MFSLSLGFNIKDFLIDNGWLLLWVTFGASALYSLFDFRDTLDDIRKETGWGKRIAKLKLIMLCVIPIILLLAALGTQWASDKSEEKLARLEMANKEVAEKAGAIDPLKQPVVSVSVFIKFSISSHVEPIILGGHITFERCGRGSRQNDSDDQVRLSVRLPDKFERGTWESGESGDTFQLEILNRTNLREFESVTVGDLMSGWDCLRIQTWMFPTNTKIREGSVTLTLNSVAQMHFEISSQPFVGVWPFLLTTPTGEIVGVNKEAIEPTITGFRFDPKRRKRIWNLMETLFDKSADPTNNPTERERMAREYTALLRSEFREYRDLPSNVIFMPTLGTNVMPSAPAPK